MREGGISLAALGRSVAVAATGSLSRAAALLGVRQPIASVILAGLGRNYGTLLLHRFPRLTLTEARYDVLFRAKLLLSRTYEWGGSINTTSDLNPCSLHEGFSTAATAIPMLAAFMREHPGLTI